MDELLALSPDVEKHYIFTPEQEMILSLVLSAIHYLKDESGDFPGINDKESFREELILYFKSDLFRQHCHFIYADPDLILEAMYKVGILKDDFDDRNIN